MAALCCNRCELFQLVLHDAFDVWMDKEAFAIFSCNFISDILHA